MRHLIIVFLLFPLISIAQGPFNKVDKLMARQQYDQAIEHLLKLEKHLQPEERLTAWEVNFPGGVWRTTHGKSHLYYQMHSSTYAIEVLGDVEILPSISVNEESSDWEFLVICLDLKSGQIVWARSVNGLMYFAVHPETDLLYLYRERFAAIVPSTGSIIKESSFSDEVEGLILGTKVFFPLEHGRKGKGPESTFKVHNPVEGKDQMIILGNFGYIPGVELGKPVWKDQWPYFVTGGKWQPDAVVSIDPENAITGWSFYFPGGKYISDGHQLGNGSYPDKWAPLAALDSLLLALDDQGTLTFLDPIDGVPMASARLAKDYISMPFQFENQLIVVSFEGVRSYSMDHLLTPESFLHAELKMKQADCLFAQEQYPEALSLLTEIVERSPQNSHAWKKRAEVCATMGASEEGNLSYSQYLTLTEQAADEYAFHKWGITRCYHLGGKPSWSLVSKDSLLYTANLSGDLWRIDPTDLSCTFDTSLHRKIEYLYEGEELTFYPKKPGDPSRSHIYQPTYALPPNLNPAWHTSGGEQRISMPVLYGGKPYRSTLNGGIRTLADTGMVILPPLMDDIGPWKIYADGPQPLGYGKGVFELGADMRPVRWLIRPKVKGVTPSYVDVAFMLTTDTSIGLVVNSSEGAVMQVYSWAGELLNEAPLGRFTSSWPGPKQFVVLGNGYLFSDRQLTWVSAKSKGKIWRMGPSLARTSGERRNDRWRYFGDLKVLNGHVFVTALDGQLYVIDVEKIVE